MTQAGAGGWNDKSFVQISFYIRIQQKKNFEKIPHKKTDKILSWRKTKFGGKDLESFVVAKLNCCFRACFGSAGHG